MRGNADAFVANQDAERLLEELRKLQLNVIDYPVPAKVWNHMDFLSGVGSGKLVYEKTFEILDQYSQEFIRTIK